MSLSSLIRLSNTGCIPNVLFIIVNDLMLVISVVVMLCYVVGKSFETDTKIMIIIK